MIKDVYDLLENGSEWLGAARKWLQWNARNGSAVTWGSNEIVGSFTVNQIEDLAAHVAIAAMNEKDKRPPKFFDKNNQEIFLKEEVFCLNSHDEVMSSGKLMGFGTVFDWDALECYLIRGNELDNIIPINRARILKIKGV